MAKQKKTGKGRLDKYYKLAKEQGYRARSAFKLIQLNKKYQFLESAKCCIDLCAAPGGWLQVASKYMPLNSVIVGVDLVPIKPVPRVITHASDITTPACRALLRQSLKDWQADVVLHDGAPNVGTAWVQDAYSQSELVLMALKVAVEFLIKGGTFVTKVFRSADYNNLIWVFNQLFGKVEATKPPSSRNVSAEIFVVCRDFLAPARLDPKFLNPKYVFKELSSGNTGSTLSMGKARENVFQPSKKTRQRSGYAEGDYTLFKTAPAEDFVKGEDAVGVLGSVNQITFSSDVEKEWLSLECTSEDVKVNCADLRVLGKGDFKALMRWRSAIREHVGLESKAMPIEEFAEEVVVDEDVDEDGQLQQELERLATEAAAQRKRERRRANEVKTRAIQRMQLQMTTPMDIGLDRQDGPMALVDVFDLAGAETRLRHANGIVESLADRMVDESDGEEATLAESLDEEGHVDRDDDKFLPLEEELDELYDAYRERMSQRDSKFKVKEARRKSEAMQEWGGIQERSGSDTEDDDGSEASEGGWDKMQQLKQRDFDEAEDDSDDDSSLASRDSQPRGVKRLHDEPDLPNKRPRLLTTLRDGKDASGSAAVWFDQDLFRGVAEELEDVRGPSMHKSTLSQPPSEERNAAADDDDVVHPDALSEVREASDEIEIVPRDAEDGREYWEATNSDEDERKQRFVQTYGLLTPEALTLASQLVNREKTRTQLVDDGFNRLTFHDKDGLPAWFLDDEAKYYKANIPVTKEAVAALRARQRALDARPIKKVAEAKARKKNRAMQRLEKAMKTAQGVSDTTDMSEREKAAQIEKLMRKGLAKGKGKKDDVKVVFARGVHRGLKGRPKGVKGRYVMVDARGKKELRAKRRKEKERKGRAKN